MPSHVNLRGDSKTTLAWAKDMKAKSELASGAAALLALMCVQLGIRVGQTSHLRQRGRDGRGGRSLRIARDMGARTINGDVHVLTSKADRRFFYPEKGGLSRWPRSSHGALAGETLPSSSLRGIARRTLVAVFFQRATRRGGHRGSCPGRDHQQQGMDSSSTRRRSESAARGWKKRVHAGLVCSQVAHDQEDFRH